MSKQKKEIEAVEPEKADKIKLVKMVKEGVYADVHPNEVENYRKGGFSEAK